MTNASSVEVSLFQLIKGSLGIMTFFIALYLIFDAFMCLGFK